jgi:uncharacterized protein YceK
METGIRILLLTAVLTALAGCASVRNWYHQRAQARAERRAAAEAQQSQSQAQAPAASGTPLEESAPPRVIEP